MYVDVLELVKEFQRASICYLESKAQKKTLQGIISEFFLLDTLKLNFERRIQPKDGLIQGLFSQYQGTFFDFQKKSRGGLPLLTSPSCTPMSVAEYASISLNILNILEKA